MYINHTNKMTDAIIDGTQINTNVFSYSAPKAHASGGKVVNLYNKNTRESLTISTPLLLTWGAQEGKDQQGNTTGKWTMSLQFPNSEYPNADGEAFLASMRALEAKVKADAMTYSKEWFGKTITSPDVMDEKFNVLLRHPKIKGTQEADVSKAPTLTVKIPCWSGSWKSEIYDEEGEPLYVNGKTNSHLSPLEFIKPKTHVICLIQCGGLWFVNGKVSITWNLKQAIVQKPKNSMEGQCLLRPKAADKEKLKTMELPVEAMVDPDGGVSAMVEDSDEEDEEEIEIAPKSVPAVVKEPEPVKEQAPPVVASEEPKKKRVITKKKVEA
jgi:hypothetical protein